MVVYTGYCRPLKQKVEFSVSEVNPVETKRGIKWAVKGYYDNHKISTFASKADAEQLLSQMDSDDIEVFGAEIAYEEPKGEVKTMTGKPHTPRTLEEDKDITPEEARTKTQLKADDPYADLDPKYMTKDGKPDMRYKVCRDIKAKMISAESFESEMAEVETVEEFNLEEFMAEEEGEDKLWDYDEVLDDGLAMTNSELNEFTQDKIEEGEGDEPAFLVTQYTNQIDETARVDSVIIVPDVDEDEEDDDAVIGVVVPEIALFEDVEDWDAEETFDAETYQKVYTAEPDRIMFEEHIPPEIWNRMGPDQKGTYITTRDETMLVAPCCGVSKAEIRVDRDANADCESCCWMGDDFHPRWWADKERPTVTMEAEEFRMDSFSGNTATVPVDIYYKMMLEIPNTVSAEKTDDGLSVIFGFHDQDVDYMEFLLDTYNPQSKDSSLVQGGEGYEAETYASTPLPRGWAEDVSGFRAETIASRDAERYESENFYSTSLENFYANVFSGSDKDSATTDFNGDVLVSENPDAFDKDEVSKMMADYEAETLQKWGDQEMMTHGKDVSFENWLQEEVESHGDVDFMDWAEHEEESHEERYGAESFEGESRPESYMVTSDVHELSKATDKLEELADPAKKYPEWWKSKLSVATDQADNLADYLEYANDSGELDRLQAEGFRSKMETYNKPKSKKMIWGLLGIGVGTALLAPNQIRELIKKYRK